MKQTLRIASIIALPILGPLSLWLFYRDIPVYALAGVFALLVLQAFLGYDAGHLVGFNQGWNFAGKEWSKTLRQSIGDFSFGPAGDAAINQLRGTIENGKEEAQGKSSGPA